MRAGEHYSSSEHVNMVLFGWEQYGAVYVSLFCLGGCLVIYLVNTKKVFISESFPTFTFDLFSSLIRRLWLPTRACPSPGFFSAAVIWLWLSETRIQVCWETMSTSRRRRRCGERRTTPGGVQQKGLQTWKDDWAALKHAERSQLMACCNERCRHKEEEGGEQNPNGGGIIRGRAGDSLSFCAMEIMSRIYLSLPLLTAPPWHFDLRGCEQFIKNGSRSKWACNAQPFSGNLNGSQPISDKVKCWRRRPADVNRPDYWERWMLTGADSAGASGNILSLTCVYTQQAWSVGCRLPPAMFYLLL